MQECWVSTSTRQVRYALPFYPGRLPYRKALPRDAGKGSDKLPLPRVKAEDYDGFAVAKPSHSLDSYLSLVKGEGETGPEDRAFLRILSAGKITNPKAAVQLACDMRAKALGKDDGSKALAVNLVRIGTAMEDSFQPEGEILWVVRFLNKSDEVVQQAWVNANTGDVQVGSFRLEHLRSSSFMAPTAETRPRLPIPPFDPG